MTIDSTDRMEAIRHNAEAARITYGPRDEWFMRRQIEQSDSWYQIKWPNQTYRIPSDARLSVEGDTVRFEWTAWYHGGDHDSQELEFPLAWTWDEDWETKAYALRDEMEKAETERTLATARREAAERLSRARSSFEYAQREASELGVHNA